MQLRDSTDPPPSQRGSRPSASMVTFEFTDMLTSLTTLHLQPDEVNAQALSSFVLFPHLPIELRLKIWLYALPKPQTLRVVAEIVIADPSFGLYMIFKICSARRQAGTFGPTNKVIGWYKGVRALNLLIVNKECHDFYVEKFPYFLPTCRSGKGRIRFSASDTVDIDNFHNFTAERDFTRAIEQDYRLQTFFTDIRRLVLPVICFTMTAGHRDRRITAVIRKFSGLSVLKGKMWVGFEDDGENQDRKQIVMDGMRAHLRAVEDALKKHREEIDQSYHVPVIDLIVDSD